MGDGSPGQLFRRAVQEHGALGVLAYRLSSFNNPEVNRDIAPMSSIPHDAEAGSWGLALSLNARDALRRALDGGPVRVRVEVESRIYPSEELTLVAEVRSTKTPEERFVFTAHVQESGANDNATGVAALAELARWGLSLDMVGEDTEAVLAAVRRAVAEAVRIAVEGLGR